MNNKEQENIKIDARRNKDLSVYSLPEAEKVKRLYTEVRLCRDSSVLRTIRMEKQFLYR